MNPHADNPHFTFIECINSYFDDLSLDDADAYAAGIADGFVTPKEAAAVARLHDLLSAYSAPTGDEHDHEAILSDPAWWAVTEAAQAAVSHLKDLLSDPDELAALSTPSVEAVRAMRGSGTA